MGTTSSPMAMLQSCGPTITWTHNHVEDHHPKPTTHITLCQFSPYVPRACLSIIIWRAWAVPPPAMKLR